MRKKKLTATHSAPRKLSNLVSEKVAATASRYIRVERQLNGKTAAYEVVRSLEYSFFYEYSARGESLELIIGDGQGRWRAQPLIF